MVFKLNACSKNKMLQNCFEIAKTEPTQTAIVWFGLHN